MVKTDKSAILDRTIAFWSRRMDKPFHARTRAKWRPMCLASSGCWRSGIERTRRGMGLITPHTGEGGQRHDPPRPICYWSALALLPTRAGRLNALSVIMRPSLSNVMISWGSAFTLSCGRFLTPNGTDLCKELTDLSEASGIKFAYHGKPRAFAQRMSRLPSNLEDFFVITERQAGGHKKGPPSHPRARNRRE